MITGKALWAFKWNTAQTQLDKTIKLLELDICQVRVELLTACLRAAQVIYTNKQDNCVPIVIGKTA